MRLTVAEKSSLFRLVRASNTNRVLGFRLGSLAVLHGSRGWVDCYRNGYFVHFGKRTLGFIPTTLYRRVNV